MFISIDARPGSSLQGYLGKTSSWLVADATSPWAPLVFAASVSLGSIALAALLHRSDTRLQFVACYFAPGRIRFSELFPDGLNGRNYYGDVANRLFASESSDTVAVRSFTFPAQ